MLDKVNRVVGPGKSRACTCLHPPFRAAVGLAARGEKQTNQE